jgi:hypothetical protein
MTRGHRESLALRCTAPSSATPCRFIPAHSGCSPSPSGSAPSSIRTPPSPAPCSGSCSGPSAPGCATTAPAPPPTPRSAPSPSSTASAPPSTRTSTSTSWSSTASSPRSTARPASTRLPASRLTTPAPSRPSSSAGCSASSSAAASSISTPSTTCSRGRGPAASASTPPSAFTAPTALAASGCCATAPDPRSPSTACGLSASRERGTAQPKLAKPIGPEPAPRRGRRAHPSPLTDTGVRRVYYQPARPTPDGRTILALSPLEFLDALSRLIPPPRAHRHRYHGVLAPNARLRSRVVTLGRDDPATADLNEGPPEAPGDETAVHAHAHPAATLTGAAARSRWAQLLARIYEVFPLRCPDCGSEMRILAFLTDPEPTGATSATSTCLTPRRDSPPHALRPRPHSSSTPIPSLRWIRSPRTTSTRRLPSIRPTPSPYPSSTSIRPAAPDGRAASGPRSTQQFPLASPRFGPLHRSQAPSPTRRDHPKPADPSHPSYRKRPKRHLDFLSLNGIWISYPSGSVDFRHKSVHLVSESDNRHRPWSTGRAALFQDNP